MNTSKNQTQMLDIFQREFSFGSVPRILLTLEGFYATHGHWPNSMQLDLEMAEANRVHHLTERGWRELQAKLDLSFDVEGTLIAEDDAGLRYEYGDNIPKGCKAPKVDIWLWGCDLRSDSLPESKGPIKGARVELTSLTLHSATKPRQPVNSYITPS